MELDSLGVLEKYEKSFDIKKYKKFDRALWFSDIYALKNSGGIYGKDYEEEFKNILKINPKLVENPKLTQLPKEISYIRIIKDKINIREYPSLNVDVLKVGMKGDVFLQLE